MHTHMHTNTDTHSPLWALADQTPVSRGLSKDVLSKGLIKKVSDVQKLRRLSLSLAVWLSLETASVVLTLFRLIISHVAILSVHTIERQNSELTLLFSLETKKLTEPSLPDCDLPK